MLRGSHGETVLGRKVEEQPGLCALAKLGKTPSLLLQNQPPLLICPARLWPEFDRERSHDSVGGTSITSFSVATQTLRALTAYHNPTPGYGAREPAEEMEDEQWRGMRGCRMLPPVTPAMALILSNTALRRSPFPAFPYRCMSQRGVGVVAWQTPCQGNGGFGTNWAPLQPRALVVVGAHPPPCGHSQEGEPPGELVFGKKAAENLPQGAFCFNPSRLPTSKSIASRSPTNQSAQAV